MSRYRYRSWTPHCQQLQVGHLVGGRAVSHDASAVPANSNATPLRTARVRRIYIQPGQNWVSSIQLNLNGH